MATIKSYETKAGRRWMVRYRKPDGKSTDKGGFRTKRAAEGFAANVEVSKMRGEYVSPTAGRATIGPLGAAWLSHKRALKPSSYRSLESSWRIHVEPRWKDVTVGKVTKALVQEWINDDFAKKSPTVVLRAHGVLAGILDHAVNEQLVIVNKARGVRLPRKTRGMHDYLSWEQLHALTEQAGKHGPFVLFLGTTGMRWGEAVGLLGKHVDRKKSRATIERNYAQIGSKYALGTPKTHELRWVPISKTVLSLVPKVMPGAHVWAMDDVDAPIPRPSPESGWFAHAVKRCMEADETFPRVSPHDLRHTAASLAVAAGANVKALQRMMGHASAAMTLDVYADLFDEDLDSVAEALESTVGVLWVKGAS